MSPDLELERRRKVLLELGFLPWALEAAGPEDGSGGRDLHRKCMRIDHSDGLATKRVNM